MIFPASSQRLDQRTGTYVDHHVVRNNNAYIVIYDRVAPPSDHNSSAPSLTTAAHAAAAAVAAVAPRSSLTSASRLSPSELVTSVSDEDKQLSPGILLREDSSLYTDSMSGELDGDGSVFSPPASAGVSASGVVSSGT